MSPLKPSDLHLIPQVITFENQLLFTLDPFTVSLHHPNGRHLLAIKALYGDCQWSPKNNSLQLRQSQLILRPANHKMIMPANWRPCFIPHWKSWCHQARTVEKSIPTLHRLPAKVTCCHGIVIIFIRIANMYYDYNHNKKYTDGNE